MLNLKDFINKKRQKNIEKEIEKLCSFFNNHYDNLNNNISSLEHIRNKQNNILYKLNANLKDLDLEIKYADFSNDKTIDVEYIKKEIQLLKKEIKDIIVFLDTIEIELKKINEDITIVGQYKNHVDLFVVLYSNSKEKYFFNTIEGAIIYYEKEQKDKIKYINRVKK